MLFVMHCLDKPGVQEMRNEVMPTHRDYLDSSGVKVVMSGPLVDDNDESKVIGSLYILDVENRAVIDKIRAEDPLSQADIWESVNVQAFVKRIG